MALNIINACGRRYPHHQFYLALFSVLSSIMWVNCNYLIYDLQFGFRAKNSTNLTEMIRDALIMVILRMVFLLTSKKHLMQLIIKYC